MWERTIVRRGSRLAVAEPTSDDRELYEIVLLAGSPRRHTMLLAAHLEQGANIDVDGEEWTVADVRTADGAPSQLICIYAA